MMDCPAASSSLAWKRSCSSSLHATICTSIKSAKQNRPAPFAVVAGCATGSTHPRHPSTGVSFSASISSLVLQYT
jgi:hypothetical protein